MFFVLYMFIVYVVNKNMAKCWLGDHLEEAIFVYLSQKNYIIF